MNLSSWSSKSAIVRRSTKAVNKAVKPFASAHSDIQHSALARAWLRRGSCRRIVAVENGRVEVGGIEAYPGTPVLDLQPYLPGVESRPGAVPPQRY